MGKVAAKILVLGNEVNLTIDSNKQFLSLTDIARYRNTNEPFSVINNWMRNRNTIEFIGLWEKLNNFMFKPLEFERFKHEAGNNHFALSPQKWIESTSAIGIISKSGRYGGTFAHVDIAFEFASWISPEFKLYLIAEFKRLKTAEIKRSDLDWNLQRTISKINYRIQTDAIKENLIPKAITQQQASVIYADEADLLNIALFGTTANEWKLNFPAIKGTLRDEASLEQLIILSNLESINAHLITQNLLQSQRLVQLNKVAIKQMQSLVNDKELQDLKRR